MLETQLRNRRIWTDALHSGKFVQTEGRLGSPDAGMCCLGVGCYVLGVKFNPDDQFPPEEFCRKVGLPFAPDLIGDEVEGRYQGGNLVDDNDTKKLTFPQIAVIIETKDSLWEDSDFQQAELATAENEQAELRALDECHDD